MKSFKLKRNISHLMRSMRSLIMKSVDRTVDATTVLMIELHSGRDILVLIEDDLERRFELINT